MQSIKGKKESLLRLFGMMMLLIATLTSVIFAFFILDLLLYIFTLMIFIPWFAIIILLKLEKDFFVNNKGKLFILLIILLVIMILIGSLISNVISAILLFSMVVISEILVMFCWHFALSIFKKEKILFLISGMAYCALTIIFIVGLLVFQLGLLLGIAPLVLVILGILLIITAEKLMKKKGLLNYI